jgi:uncharacterized phiE125 gp8 family phage protein
MPFKVTTSPAVEPLQVSDPIVKQTMRIIDTAEDALITMLLGRAREAAEQLTWRALITQGITLTMDQFPMPGSNVSSANWYGPSWGVGPGPLTVSRADGTTGYEILLPRSPVQTVSAITYYDVTGTLQTLDSSLYIVDNISEPARVVPAPGTTWPGTQNRINAVQVVYTAGYGASGASVPSGIVHWILLTTGTFYENREMVAVLNKGKVELLPYVNGLLDSYAIRSFNPPSYWL